MDFHHMRDSNAWREQNLKMTTGSNECCKLYDAALTQYVTWYESDAFGGLEKTLEDMLSCDENFILGQCLNKGISLIGTSSSPDGLKLKRQLDDFESLLQKQSGLTKRELDHAEAIKNLFKGNITASCELWEKIMVDHPTDLMAIKFAHDAYFYLGYHPQMRDSIARILPSWKSSIPLYSSLYGMYSFGLVQSGFFQQAYTTATKALEMNKNDAWATHSLCHFYEYTSEYDLGIKFMNKTEVDWSICNLLSSHNYWHLALYHIERFEHEIALNIFKKHILKNISLDRTLDMVDAISLLYRLQLDSCEVYFKNEWNEIARVYKNRSDNHGYIFNDSHIAMMLSESDSKEEESLFMSSLNEYLSTDLAELPKSIDYLKKINVNYAERIFGAIFSFKNKDFSKVVDSLYPIRYEIVNIGGSNAQRDILQQLLIQSALRSESKFHNNIGLGLLNERRAIKPNSKLTERIITRYT